VEVAGFYRSAASLFLPLQHFGIFHHAVETADGDVDQAGQAITEALADKVEFDEANDGAQGDAREACPLACGQRHLGGQRGVAVLLAQVTAQRFGRFVQQIT
jgi:hypothetical protein